MYVVIFVMSPVFDIGACARCGKFLMCLSSERRLNAVSRAGVEECSVWCLFRIIVWAVGPPRVLLDAAGMAEG